VIDLAAQARQDLAELDAALGRVAAGTYGSCERCGRPIPPERLAAHLTARACVACAGAQASAAAISSRVNRAL
jgi:RNA polymerase-binding transcription factor DksA